MNPFLAVALIWVSLGIWRNAAIESMPVTEGIEAVQPKTRGGEMRMFAPRGDVAAPAPERRVEIQEATPWSSGLWLARIPTGVFHAAPASLLLILFLLARRATPAENHRVAG
jgi:hypothetical protein